MFFKKMSNLFKLTDFTYIKISKAKFDMKVCFQEC